MPSTSIPFCSPLLVSVEIIPVEPPMTAAFQAYSHPSFWDTGVSRYSNRIFFQIIPNGPDPLIQDDWGFENFVDQNIRVNKTRSYKVFSAPFPGTIPLYRYFYAASTAHVYLTEDQMWSLPAGAGRDDGIAFCAFK